MTNQHDAILSWAAIFVLLKAFANGGSSLTGLEAISNGVSAFQPPAGVNARRTLSLMSLMLGFLVAGVSYLAVQTHAVPYTDGAPTVISQVAKAAFGTSSIGHVGFVLVQLATALILYTGANTPFTGFPFLASFVAEDSFLPRQLTRRGHRLAFSNGIIVLTVSAIVLLLAVGANVDHLVPFYAIGVFTGFTMAGLGMAKYHWTRREPGWRHRLVINFAAGIVSLLVVVIFAVVKFTEGAWLVVILFPLGWFALVRLNQQYREEQHALDLVTAAQEGGYLRGHYARHVVLVFVRSARSRGHSGAAICRQPPPDGDPCGPLNDRQRRRRGTRGRVGSAGTRRPGATLRGGVPRSTTGSRGERAGAKRGRPGPGRGHRVVAAPHIPAIVTAFAPRPNS